MINKKSSLAQTRRDKIIESVRSRGKKVSNIWVLLAPLTNQDVILIGDLKMEHFYSVEGDPRVRQVVYQPDPVEVKIGSETRSIQFDAIVQFLDNRRECRCVRNEASADPSANFTPSWNSVAAEFIGATFVEITASDLDDCRQRILNWRRALATLARCRSHPLELIEFEIVTWLGGQSRVSIDSLLTHFSDTPAAIILAAVVRLLRNRTLSSDLDTIPWSRHTQISSEAVV